MCRIYFYFILVVVVVVLRNFIPFTVERERMGMGSVFSSLRLCALRALSIKNMN
uniref:Uncharacterized protein n=1 Tax=Anguilla anguilla TaxID=7936 RepID=A0A0E9UK42_ANGAN